MARHRGLVATLSRIICTLSLMFVIMFPIIPSLQQIKHRQSQFVGLSLKPHLDPMADRHRFRLAGDAGHHPWTFVQLYSK